MSDTYKTKAWGKRKRLNERTFLTEKMADRKCGAIDDKLSKLEILKKLDL